MTYLAVSFGSANFVQHLVVENGFLSLIYLVRPPKKFLPQKNSYIFPKKTISQTSLLTWPIQKEKLLSEKFCYIYPKKSTFYIQRKIFRYILKKNSIACQQLPNFPTINNFFQLTEKQRISYTCRKINFFVLS